MERDASDARERPEAEEVDVGSVDDCMKILVTGGAGFIGANFAMRALKEGEVTVLDSLTYAGNMDSLREAAKSGKFRFVKGDIRDGKVVGGLVKEAELVVNFAAESHVDYSIANPQLFFSTNVAGTLTLLEAARKNDVAFLQISTDEVYGEVKRGESREGDALRPSSPYSASKASADLLVGAYCRTYGADAKITRTTNNYGPYQHVEKLMPKFTVLALAGRKLPVYGSGKSVREWIRVEDNCEAIMAVARKGKKGEVYNIGSGERKSVLEVAKAILDATGGGRKLLSHERERPGEDCRYALDCSKVRALGWKPRMGFEEGIKATVEWYSRNRWWWGARAKNHDFSSRHAK